MCNVGQDVARLTDVFFLLGNSVVQENALARVRTAEVLNLKRNVLHENALLMPSSESHSGPRPDPPPGESGLGP